MSILYLLYIREKYCSKALYFDISIAANYLFAVLDLLRHQVHDVINPGIQFDVLVILCKNLNLEHIAIFFVCELESLKS